MTDKIARIPTALQLARDSIAALLPPGITVTVEPFGDRWTAEFQVAGRLPTTLGFSHSLQDLVQCCVDRREWLIERVRAELDAVDVLGGEVGKSGSAATTCDCAVVLTVEEVERGRG